jgi:hypothetical protein
VPKLQIRGALPLAVLFALGGGAAAQEGVFAGLAGSWSGSGTVTTAQGSENIRCRGAYAVSNGGASVRTNLRCASDSYTIDLRSDLTSEGGRLSGRWSESTRNVAGSVSGTAAPGRIAASVGGSGFSASITMTTSGNRQTIAIRSQGGEVSAVTITLRKS